MLLYNHNLHSTETVSRDTVTVIPSKMSGGDEIERDEVFEKAEQEVMSFLPEMDADGLAALIGELGLDIPEGKEGNRRQLYRFVWSFLMDVEKNDADGGKTKYLQIHTYLRQMSIDKLPAPANKETPAPELHQVFNVSFQKDPLRKKQT